MLYIHVDQQAMINLRENFLSIERESDLLFSQREREKFGFFARKRKEIRFFGRKRRELLFQRERGKFAFFS
jgi:hypothetical protein